MKALLIILLSLASTGAYAQVRIHVDVQRRPALIIAAPAPIIVHRTAVVVEYSAPPAGTVFATRNHELVGNRKHAKWNHIAIMGPNGWVIEAQAKRGVIAVPYSNFYARYPKIQAFLVVPLDRGAALASAAVAQLRQPYRLLKDNCVDLLRDCMRTVYDKPMRHWHTPDQVVRKATAQVLWIKIDMLWTPPQEFFAGAVNDAEFVLSHEAP